MQDPGVKKPGLTKEQWRAMVMERLRMESARMSNKATTRMEIQDQIRKVAEAKRARRADRLAKQLPVAESK